MIPSWRDRSTRQELRERIEGALEARHRPRRILCLTACLAAAFILLPAPPRAGAAVQTPDPGSTQEPAIHWTRPVPGARLTSPFGPRRDPFTGDAAHHDGVDLGAPEGTPVVAMADGTVSVATEHDEAEPARGTLVVIDHPGGYRSLYSHLQDLEVETGQAVTAGQTIGHLGRTGAVTAPHVHVEVHHDGQPVDPAGLWAP